jgi:hypothetical protein
MIISGPLDGEGISMGSKLASRAFPSALANETVTRPYRFARSAGAPLFVSQ